MPLVSLIYNLYFFECVSFFEIAKMLDFIFIEVAWRELPSGLRHCDKSELKGS